jgi:glycine cleavage system H protein
MSDKHYTEDHEWVSIEGDIATMGISNYAQDQLGDVVFVELPDKGAAFEKGAEVAVVESVKAASEVYAPVSGEVVEINEAIGENPSLVNEDAEGKGWFLKIKVAGAADLSDLMDASAYADKVAD